MSTSKSQTTSTIKRLLQELSTSQRDIQRNPCIEHLAPTSEDNLYHWTAIINGHGLGAGYEHGRWGLSIFIPNGQSSSSSKSSSSSSKTTAAYPLSPPTIRFKTKVLASNVNWKTGEICLDLLADKWSPAYTLASTVDAIVQMLAVPGVDSPLCVDLAALLRDGDHVGASSLVRLRCEEERFEGAV